LIRASKTGHGNDKWEAWKAIKSAFPRFPYSLKILSGLPHFHGLFDEKRYSKQEQGPTFRRWRSLYNFLQYQKQLRLQAARGHMLLDGLDAASAGFEVGYESVSQFNREYSRFFGQPPKRDIRTLYSPGAPALESVSNR
jgi:AraC-like DNA-binding protein